MHLLHVTPWQQLRTLSWQLQLLLQQQMHLWSLKVCAAFRESSISRCIHLPWSDRSDWRSPCAVQLQGNFQLLLSQLLRECHPSHVSVTCMTQATSEFGSGRMHAAAGSHIYPQGAGRDRLSLQCTLDQQLKGCSAEYSPVMEHVQSVTCCPQHTILINTALNPLCLL